MTELEFRELSVNIGERTLLDRNHAARRARRVRGADRAQRRRQDDVAQSGPRVARAQRGLGAARWPRRERARRARPRSRHRLAAQQIRADEPVTALESVAAARLPLLRKPRQITHGRSSRASLAWRAAPTPSARSRNFPGVNASASRSRACSLKNQKCCCSTSRRTIWIPRSSSKCTACWASCGVKVRTLVCINHDVNLLRQVRDAERVRVIGLRDGRIAFDARFADPDLPAHLGALFEIRMDALEATDSASSCRARGASREGAAAGRRVRSIAAGRGVRRAALERRARRVHRLAIARTAGAGGGPGRGHLGARGRHISGSFQNPLATSDTVGTTAGATVGALFALVLDSSRTVQGLPLVTVCAFLGALGASLLVAKLCVDAARPLE